MNAAPVGCYHDFACSKRCGCKYYNSELKNVLSAARAAGNNNIKRKKGYKMVKKLFSIIVALVLMLSLTVTAYGADEPGTVTTFNGTVEISNVTKIGDILFDETFDMEKVDEQIGASDKPIPFEDYYELYYAKAPVTVTLKRPDRDVFSILWYYIIAPDAKFEIKKYEANAFNYDTGKFEPTPAYEGTITINKPGAYYFYFMNNSASSDEFDRGFYLIVEGQADSAPATIITVEAKPTASTVLVNGKQVEFDAYHINGNNYFKLRDLAQAVNNTEKNFEVVWDGTKKAINLISNQPYTPVGGELTKGDGKAKDVKPTSAKIYIDGEEISLTAYHINGNNYFKLRDIAKIFDIGVSWDGATKTVIIDTSTGYVEE